VRLTLLNFVVQPGGGHSNALLLLVTTFSKARIFFFFDVEAIVILIKEMTRIYTKGKRNGGHSSSQMLATTLSLAKPARLKAV
jgi:hypothetical protein